LEQGKECWDVPELLLSGHAKPSSNSNRNRHLLDTEKQRSGFGRRIKIGADRTNERYAVAQADRAFQTNKPNDPKGM
jgi:hypothetical protein